jgi:DNA-directed RNA polymerase specialized sigma24 family protein
VDREQALRRLPEGHVKAIRLRDQGLDDEAIAGRLGIPVEGVEPVLRMAEAKLAALVNRSSREFASPPADEGRSHGHRSEADAAGH